MKISDILREQMTSDNRAFFRKLYGEHGLQPALQGFLLFSLGVGTGSLYTMGASWVLLLAVVVGAVYFSAYIGYGAVLAFGRGWLERDAVYGRNPHDDAS